MSKKAVILGIETSCDETSVSIVTEDNMGNPKILSNIISSQVDVHKEFGGVVPELAARSHLEKIDLITKKALNESKINLNQIDAISATAGPGMVVCLNVGLNFGKGLAKSLKKPFIAVNHLEGHALSPMLNSSIKFLPSSLLPPKFSGKKKCLPPPKNVETLELSICELISSVFHLRSICAAKAAGVACVISDVANKELTKPNLLRVSVKFSKDFLLESSPK